MHSRSVPSPPDVFPNLVHRSANSLPLIALNKRIYIIAEFGAGRSDSIEHCYWNIDAADIDTSAGGVGLSAEEFADPENFEGFVFCPGDDCRWVMDDDESRPVLESFAE